MDAVAGTLFIVIGLMLSFWPSTASEFIAQHQLGGPRKDGRRASDSVMRLVGVVFVAVGGLAVLGQWPPG